MLISNILDHIMTIAWLLSLRIDAVRCGAILQARAAENTMLGMVACRSPPSGARRVAEEGSEPESGGTRKRSSEQFDVIRTTPAEII
jgi:hypothetical protein